MYLVSKFSFILLVLTFVLVITACGNNEITAGEEPQIINFTDDFSNPNSGWPEESSDEAILEYVDGKYQIKALKSGYLFGASSPVGKISNQCSIEADMTFPEGNQGMYGFILKCVEDANTYVFMIDPVYKNYCFGRYENNEWFSIIEWTENNEAIKQFNNRVKFKREDEKIRLTINDIKLTEKEVFFPTAEIIPGILTATFNDINTIPFIVQFDNVKITGKKFK